MNRRAFLWRLASGVTATAALRAVPLSAFVWPTPAPVGLSIRLVREFNVQTDRMVSRIDVLYGVAVLRPELALRVSE